MPGPAKRYQPSPLYVFVTLFLATFLLLFTIWREPGTLYETQSSFATTATKEQLAEMLTPEAVLRALYQAEMISGSHPDLLSIAEGITKRMRLDLDDASEQGSLALTSRHPQAAIQLLNTLMLDVANAPREQPLLLSFEPAMIARVRGGSIEDGQLAVLSVLAAIIGLCAVVLTNRAHTCTLLLTRSEVERATGLPVVTELAGEVNLPAKTTKHVAQRRFSHVALRAAELTVAAVFLLMVYQLATQNGLPSRFVHDPLAAYGEVLTGVMG